MYFPSSLSLPLSLSLSLSPSAGNEYKIVNTPAFAESISEGDVKWDKSKSNLILCIHVHVHVCALHVHLQSKIR